MSGVQNDLELETNWEKRIEDFESMGLKKELLRGIYAYNFETPSEIQKCAIPALIEGRDTIAQAQSGTGKTATFAISILQNIDETVNQTQALVVAPTRELALQSFDVIKNLSSRMEGVSVRCCVGGTRRDEDLRALRDGVQIVVGTCGRINDIAEQMPNAFRNLKILCVDEADQMLSDNFTEQIQQILHSVPPAVQVVLISATMPPEILRMVNSFMRDPVRILVKADELTLEGIRQFYIDCEREDWKYDCLTDLYQSMSVAACFVFCNTRRKVEALQQRLTEDGHTVSVIHGDMTQQERTKVMREFREGASRVLVSTDLLARGIDVQQVSLIINYDVPQDIETYLHRIGRSGRFGRKGLAINFVAGGNDLEQLGRIASHYGTEISPPPENLNELI